MERENNGPDRHCEPEAKQFRAAARVPGLLRRCAPRNDAILGFAAAILVSAGCATPAAWAKAPHQVADGPCPVVRQTNVSTYMRDGT
ncbi:MAG: hypothetical protein ACREF1_06450, partial [Acetobacteraceae bacterium]